MSVWYRSIYWLLGDGADEEAKRWVADDKHKKIVYSSQKAVEMEEIGNHLPPELPIPPTGFVVVVIRGYSERRALFMRLFCAAWDT